ncbi:MAG: hypothetical protein HRU70_08400 [Phycisphaeraceae bacterium]|nr:MAG: hypothetical protein HRU70_08400 [Phycisphaeraceae bacterium]
MKNRMKVMGLVLAAGCVSSAMGQDSVSSSGGFPGDAVWAGGAGVPGQGSAYTVKLTPFRTSWGTRLGIAPLAKASRSQATFFNNLISAQYISQTQLSGVPSASASYASWTAAGGGVNSPANNLGLNTNVAGPASSTQFGFVFADFGGRENPIIGGVVNYSANDPSTLYVTRVTAAFNAVDGADTAQFGTGSADARGNVYFRADDFGPNGPNRILEDNIFRVRTVSYGALDGRDVSTVNLIDNDGGADADATDWLVVRDTVSWNTPCNVPSGLSENARGAYIGSNFGTNYAYEAAPLTIAQTTSHRPGTVDHRGNVSFTPARLLGGTGVGTSGMVTKATSGSPTETVSLWTVGSNGVPSNAISLSIPRGAGVTIADPCSGFQWPIETGDFRSYQGTSAFRGGNGQVALARDQGGNGLVAAEVNSTFGGATGANNPYNGIAVYRFPAGQPGNGSWTMAAWIDLPNGMGKEIYGDFGNDGVAFTGDAGEFDGVVDLNPNSPTYDAPIGFLAPHFLVTGGVPLGPGMSSPAFDSVGNLYFLSTVGLYKQNGFIDYDNALVRGIYDRQTNCYRLELMLELGDTFLGQNSGTRYQVQFITLSASDGANSGGFWSGNVSAASWNNTDVSNLDVRDPRALGGLVLNAKIVYDRDGDGDFSDPTATSGDPGSGDEAYSAVLFIGYPGEQGPPPCLADFNGDDFVDFFDLDAFVECFEGGACPDGKTADFNGDDFIDFFDLDAYIEAFEQGC